MYARKITIIVSLYANTSRGKMKSYSIAYLGDLAEVTLNVMFLQLLPFHLKEKVWTILIFQSSISTEKSLKKKNNRVIKHGLPAIEKLSVALQPRQNQFCQ